jgi:hypothetical protein
MNKLSFLRDGHSMVLCDKDDVELAAIYLQEGKSFKEVADIIFKSSNGKYRLLGACDVVHCAQEHFKIGTFEVRGD